jgi:hypothetical protein
VVRLPLEVRRRRRTGSHTRRRLRRGLDAPWHAGSMTWLDLECGANVGEDALSVRPHIRSDSISEDSLAVVQHHRSRGGQS